MSNKNEKQEINGIEIVRYGIIPLLQEQPLFYYTEDDTKNEKPVCVEKYKIHKPKILLPSDIMQIKDEHWFDPTSTYYYKDEIYLSDFIKQMHEVFAFKLDNMYFSMVVWDVVKCRRCVVYDSKTKSSCGTYDFYLRPKVDTQMFLYKNKEAYEKAGFISKYNELFLPLYSNLEMSLLQNPIAVLFLTNPKLIYIKETAIKAIYESHQINLFVNTKNNRTFVSSIENKDELTEIKKRFDVSPFIEYSFANEELLDSLLQYDKDYKSLLLKNLGK